MSFSTTTIIWVVLFFSGLGLGYLIRRLIADARIRSAESKAQNILSEAKSKSQDLLLEAKNKALKVLEEAKNENRERHAQLGRIEHLLSKKERELEEKTGEIDKTKKVLTDKVDEVAKIKTELEERRGQQIAELEKISGLKKEEALRLMNRNIEEEYRNDIYEKIKKLEMGNNETLDQKAKELMATAIQRYSSSHISDITTTVVNLPSDEIKGKIIGKEGRNIKTIERLTGVDVIIDDTPETLILSSFDPVRRHTAKLALEKLIADGRIHPAKIEDVVDKAKAEINEKIKEAGEAALYETGIGPIDPKLTFLLGRLAFRNSFGQNVLLHSIEMAHVAAMLAQELGADVSTTKKAALFHDIGKAVDHEVQGSHVEIGRKILQKFNMDEKVVKAMEAHHDEYPYTSIESRIIQAADAISAARPGARRDTVEIYLKRLEDLERIANSFDGVEKSYAVQAGRELRIFVTPVKVDDLTATKMARDIAKRIEEEIRYPGEIKVTIIRETRAIEYAR